MPILEIPGEIEVELTHACNWNCPYCAERYKMVDPISYDAAQQKIDQIQPNSIVTISGGEPGLIDRPCIESYIRQLKDKNCTLYLNTNGTFLARYPDLVHFFDEVVYHCSEDLDPSIPVDISDYGTKIDYMVIVDDENICRLKQFIDANPGIKFDIVEATYNNVGDGPTLSPKNKHYIMTAFSKYMTKTSVKRMIHEKDFDKLRYL